MKTVLYCVQAPKLVALLGIALLTVNSAKVVASDHVDGEISINNSVADISDLYAFPSPRNPDRLVLILNSYPFVSSKGHFSDRLQYSFRIRPVTASGTGVNAGFNFSNQEYRIDCSFKTPHDNTGHSISCVMPNKEVVTNKVGNISSDASAVQVFAGRRSDPFLFSASWFKTLVFEHCIPPANASNDIKDLNVLSIVIEMNTKDVFTSEHQNLLAIAGEVGEKATANNPYKPIDRVGRPEVSNGRLVPNLDQPDLREMYNAEDTFSLNLNHKPIYEERILQNVRYYDQLDDVIDWQPEWKQAITRILINDYLVVDTTKPFTNTGYFDIEHALLRNEPHARSGGRMPGEGVINTLVNNMVSDGFGQPISDGIPDVDISQRAFPYLEKPNTGIVAWIKQFLAPKFVSSLSLKKRSATETCK